MLILNKIRSPVLRLQPARARHITIIPNNAFHSRNSRPHGKAAPRTTASASFMVSLMGVAIWYGDLKSPSSVESPLGDSTLLPRSSYENRNRTISKNGSRPSKAISAYPRLSETEKTRIVILEPGEPTDELRCHLKHICSLQDHEYEALSYVWGEKSSEHTIECSGMTIQITSNLDDALRQLRYTDISRLLWVDAVSINQEDLVERSCQVRIMQEIYANAAQVVIWLGRDAEDDNRAFSSLQALKSVVNGQNDSWLLVRLGWFRDKNGRVFSGGAHRSMLTDIQYEHLIKLLHREWFRRTWVIQEVASSQRATVYCGNQTIPWEILADVYMRLGDRFLPVSQMGGEEAHHSLENISAIERARRSHSGPLSMSLFHILLATRFSKCQDQRDKIFAVVGLVKDWAGQRGLIPDYNTSEEKVYEAFKDFAIADINYHKDLRVLSCASGPSASSSLPSWVPDWRVVENVHPLTRYSERTRFCASGGMKPEAWYSDKSTVLHVTGLHVDSIASLGSEPEFTKAIAVFEINPAKISAVRQSFLWLQECENLSRQREGILTAERQNELWRTMTCGLTGEAFPAPGRYSKYFNRYLGFMSSAAERFEDYLTESRTTVSGVRGLDEVIPNFATHAVIEASLDVWSSRRRFAVTRDGRLACVPKNSRVGDSICVLFGGEVPFVLRPAGGGLYAVVGECYVDDIMHGESLSHDTMPREFRLK